ncbi:hypothetical protein EYF80_051941 [Liparis tanakae]|uniref:Uncharacterized protein n=1 Tax=Liparis tanakae TaxID=230148 RepID=A0A4Z2FBY5_9TELE|nr:hypothetical protein EYF80_051941 [Liparis tanakae]
MCELVLTCETTGTTRLLSSKVLRPRRSAGLRNGGGGWGEQPAPPEPTMGPGGELVWGDPVTSAAVLKHAEQLQVFVVRTNAHLKSSQ